MKNEHWETNVDATSDLGRVESEPPTRACTIVFVSPRAAVRLDQKRRTDVVPPTLGLCSSLATEHDREAALYLCRL